MTILRSGPTKKYSSNWASAFGNKKSAKVAKKAKSAKKAVKAKKKSKKK